jgi:ABC-type oligopeptide transport system substrate-binding subunit
VSEPIAAMGTWLESGAHYNSAAESKTIDELAAKIKGDVDRQSRIKDYQALAREFYEKAYAVPIASVPSLYAYNPKVVSKWPLQPGEAYISGYDYATPAK